MQGITAATTWVDVEARGNRTCAALAARRTGAAQAARRRAGKAAGGRESRRLGERRRRGRPAIGRAEAALAARRRTDRGSHEGRWHGAGARGALANTAAGFACVALAVTLVAAGFGACCLPVTTQLLSQATSNFEDTPYAPAQLTALAVATRDFTVDDYGRSALGTQGAQDVLAQRILDAAREASGEQSPVRGRWSQAARDVVENPPSASPAQVAFTALAGVGDAYALDRDAVSHLEDCNRLVRTAVPVLWGTAALAAALLIALVATAGAGRRAGRSPWRRRCWWWPWPRPACGRRSTSTACSPRFTGCSSRRATGRSASTAC